MIFKKQLIAATLCAAAMLPAPATAKHVVVPKVYMFGFSASFNDTIVHFTEIQTVENVWMDNKTHFLLGRENYSNMLRDYLAQQQMPQRTCIVIFDENLKKLQKKFLKMKKLYTKARGKKVKNHNDVRTIATDDFKFKAIDMGYNEEEETSGN